MSEFLASNGAVIGRNREQLEVTGDTYYEWIDLEAEKALREFFQHERDDELGRWRWPENPDYTVREAPQHARRLRSEGITVAIEQESIGYVAYYSRSGLPELTNASGGIIRAGHAYFENRRDPWHDAKDGDIWVLTIGPNVKAYQFDSTNRYFDQVGSGGTKGIPAHSQGIISGRKIWPEVAS